MAEQKNNTKKIIVISLIVLSLTVVSVYGLKLYKKYKDSDLLQYEPTTFDLGIKVSNPLEILGLAGKLLSGGTTADFGLLVKNFSNSKFTVNSIYIEVYTMEGDLIVSQDQQLSAPLVIPPNSNAVLNVPLYVKTSGIVNLAKQLGENTYTPLQAVKNILQSYLLGNGKFGTRVRLKGSFTAEGLTFINIPLDEVIDI